MRIRLPARPIRIETERFCMRTMSRREAARASFAWTETNEVMQALQLKAGGWKRRRWQRQFARFDNRKNFCFGIWTKSENRFIGYHLVRVTGGKVAFVGVVIGDARWWGEDVVVETRAALIDDLFENRGIHRVWGAPFARNFPSIYNYQRLGFTY